MRPPRSLQIDPFRYLAAAALALAAAACIFAADGAAGSLRWETETQSFPAEIGQEQVVATYPFTNAGDAPVTISKATASCGCTVPTLDKTVYQPGESGELTAIFTIGSRQGHQQKTIQVLTEEGSGSTTYSLQLEVEIPVPVTLTPRVRFWRVGEDTAMQEIRVSIDAAVPMSITGLERQAEPQSESPFAFEVETVTENQEYLVRLTPRSSETKSRDVFYLTSPDDPSGLLRNYPIYAYVR